MRKFLFLVCVMLTVMSGYVFAEGGNRHVLECASPTFQGENVMKREYSLQCEERSSDGAQSVPFCRLQTVTMDANWPVVTEPLREKTHGYKRADYTGEGGLISVTLDMNSDGFDATVGYDNDATNVRTFCSCWERKSN